MRRVALVLALTLLLPTALAHILHERPHIQAAESRRAPELTFNGTTAMITLRDTVDPLRNLIRYEVNPARMSFAGEHRSDPSVAEGAFASRWEITRILAFRDANHDEAFQPGTDAVTRSWRFTNYQWRTDGAHTVSVGGVTGVDDVVWNGTLAGAPNVSLEMVIPGADISDEGAHARPQDLLFYLTFPNLPPRELGTLYALEGSLVTAPGVAMGDQVLAEKVTIDVFGEKDGRRTYLDWGGTGQLDGREANATWRMDDPAPLGANEQRAFRLSFPIFEHSLRMVIVTGLEYTLPERKIPDATIPLAVAVVIVALVIRRPPRRAV